MPARIRIGLSGWTYPHWRSRFYPAGLPQRRELAYAATIFDTMEINGSFYSLQRPSSYQRWREATPDGFVFAVKGGRFITHLKKLRDVEQPLANFFASGVLALEEKLGPLLWQLPPMLPYQRSRMEDFFALLPRSAAEAAAVAQRCDDRIKNRFGEEPVVTVAADRPLVHAVEIRHPSYGVEEFAALCREAGIALVVADTAGRFPWVDTVTADVVYVRLHGDAELYASAYTDQGIAWWADRVTGWAETPGVHSVFVYYDNDADANAPNDARRLRDRLGLVVA